MEISHIKEKNWLLIFNIIEFDKNSKIPESFKSKFWVLKNLITHCFNCAKTLSFYLNKGHCRICGNIFCKNCLNKIIECNLPKGIVKATICNQCYNLYQDFNKLMEKKFILKKENNENILELKITSYCNSYNNFNINEENENNIKTLDENNFENKIQNDINDLYEGILKILVHNILINNLGEELTYKWDQIIYLLVKESIENLRPSCKYLDDSLNINDYIKIKTIKDKDYKNSHVINGYALSKNVKFNETPLELINPRILIIDNKNIVNEMKVEFKAKEAYYNIINNKIKATKANILITGENFPKDFSKFLDSEINFIPNLNSNKLKKLERCLQTIVYPSSDLIGNKTILGTCKLFKIDFLIYKKEIKHLMSFEGCDPLLFSTILLYDENKEELKKIKKLLKKYILPTARDLFLQKNMYYIFNYESPDLSLLPKIDYINYEKLKNNLILNKFLYEKKNNINKLDIKEINEDVIHNYFQGFNIDLIQDENEIEKEFKIDNINNEENNNQINKSENNEIEINNINNLYLNLLKYTISKSDFDIKKFKLGLNENIVLKTFKKIINNDFFNNQNINISNIIFENEEEKKSEGNEKEEIFNNNNNNDNNNNNNVNDENNNNNNINTDEEKQLTEKIKEIQIQSNRIKICEEPQDIYFKSYSHLPEYDKPLGIFILDLCKQSLNLCENCKRPQNSHIYYLFQGNGRLTISMILNKTKDSYDLILKYLYKNKDIKINQINNNNNYDLLNSDIFTYGFCNKCNNIVTPLFKLNNEHFNYSSTKFFSDMLENHLMSNFNKRKSFNIFELIKDKSENCEHFMNKEIKRIFVTKFGAFQFEYDYVNKYFLLPMNLNSLSDSNQENVKLKYKKIAFEKSVKVTNSFLNFFNFQEKVFNQIFNFEHMKHYKKIVDKIIKIINKLKEKTQYLIEKIIIYYLYENSEYNFENYLKIIIFIKKLYLRIIQIKLICNKIDSLNNKLLIYSKILIKKILEPDNKINNNNNNNEENENILNSIENSDDYKSMINFLNYYDEEHTEYSCEINENDFFSIIAYTLTSNDYIEFINSSNFQYNKIKVERNNQEIVKNLIAKNIKKRRISRKLSLNLSEIKGLKNKKKKNNQIEILYDTLLLFDQSKQKFIVPGEKNENNFKFLQFLENELISNEDDIKFKYSFHNNFEKYLFFGDFNIKKNFNSFNLRTSNSNLDLKKNNNSHKFFSENNNNLKTNEFNFFIKFTKILKDFYEDLNQIKIEINEETNKYKENLKKINQENLNNSNNNNNNILFEVPEFEAEYKLNKKNYFEDSIIKKSKKFNEIEIVIYYPKQFEALRLAYCATYNEFILSISKSEKWTKINGGKSKAIFYKSIDNKYIIKGIKKFEFKMFISSAKQYFYHNIKYLFHKMPSLLSKILGVYKIKIINKNNKEDKYYFILMENLYYGLSDIFNPNMRIYDLKGSEVNRYIEKKDKNPGKVLFDTNFLEDSKGEPLFIDNDIYNMFKNALYNDSLMLNNLEVVDYSLLLIIDESDKNCKLIKIGIIDYIRKYTWDKFLEYGYKKMINKFNPTIIKPEEYRKRFYNTIENYFIGI